MSEPTEFQRAEADTVMFASARAVLPDATRENRFPGLDDPRNRTTGPRSARHQKSAHQRNAHPVGADRLSRRVWVSRGVLVLIMVLQAALTLRMSNTAFEDEGLYLYVGHLEIRHLLHGVALQGDYPSYFSGAPVLYPVLGALADSIGGLAAARALSLLEMLAVTGLIYSLSRRLFNERVALCAAVVYAVTEPALYLGRLATYDATALLLLTLATWLVVRFSAQARPLCLLAAPVLVLAVATKYATLLFVPSVIGLAGLVASPRLGRKTLVTSAALGAATVALLVGVAYLAGPDYLTGFKFTTFDRFEGTTSTQSLLWDAAQWIGVPFLLAVIGAVGWVARPFTDRSERVGPGGSRARRALLGGLMAGSALLAPIEQIRIHTETSLYKHVGFGLMLAAPIAGVGLARIIGDHFRRTQIGIAIWGASLAIGMTCANNLFDSWPDSSVFVADLARYVQPGDRYLVEVEEVPIYYLRANPGAQPRQFTSTYFIGYTTKQGQYLTGNAGYIAAIQAGYFNVVAFNYQTTPAVDAVLAKTLAADPHYSLADVIPNGDDTVRQYIWVKTGG
jgi:Dolichyl-phosphate-mannose-protein mannosyltransferase